MTPGTERPLQLLSLVIPVFNEAAVLPLLLDRLLALRAEVGVPMEMIFVDDGSDDGSAGWLDAAAQRDRGIRVVAFSRNFGHQMAITAGIDAAQGDAVVVMDADLQDPPRVVLDMLARYREGFDVVYAQRTVRHGESLIKRLTARGFYWIMRTAVHPELPSDTGDFRLMSRQVADVLRQMREHHRFVRGMVTWAGFRQTAVPYVREARAAGETKYPMRKMIAFAWRAITSFSGAPLRLGLGVGLTLTLGAIGYAGYAAVMALVFHTTVPGWASLVCLLVGLSGMIIAMLGLVGDYVVRIYEELKGRPLYVVRATANLEAPKRSEAEG